VLLIELFPERFHTHPQGLSMALAFDYHPIQALFNGAAQVDGDRRQSRLVMVGRSLVQHQPQLAALGVGIPFQVRVEAVQ
jgi:hypothetical protein